MPLKLSKVVRFSKSIRPYLGRGFCISLYAMPVRPWHLRTLLLKACFQPQNGHSKAQNDHELSDLSCSIIHLARSDPRPQTQQQTPSQTPDQTDQDHNRTETDRPQTPDLKHFLRWLSFVSPIFTDSKNYSLIKYRIITLYRVSRKPGFLNNW